MFVKKDEEFECVVCKRNVGKLKYTSRDHCNYCLHSLHVDITPGDRLNTCHGVLEPISIETHSKKQQIVYRCKKCGSIVKNVVADDDSRDEIYKVARKFAINGGNK